MRNASVKLYVVRRLSAAFLMLSIIAVPAGCASNQTLLQNVAGGPTRVVPPENNYSPAQDVQIGQEAAAEARKQLPMLDDALVDSYVQAVGRRLVAAIPSQFQHPQFRYSFEVVNARDINAFALPGGPMFLNRGMLAAAETEGEVAGVMAHELSHVILRHGTAQASAATPYQVGELAGQILGAIVGGQVGGLIAQGSRFGISLAFMRYSREFEKQADIEGAHVMARAGYDPRDMANMFRTLEEQGGAGVPEWFSDHPDPGNRYAYIVQEARTLSVVDPVRNTRRFEQMQARLQQLPDAPRISARD
jgi:predicted Zn-dependent protease